jgi:copper chaperone NosL
MLKKVFIIILFFILLLILLFSTTDFKKSIVVTENNNEKKAILISPNQYTDRYCNMSITDISYSAQAIVSNNNTFFFDDVGCMILWLNEQKNPKTIILWVWAKDTNRYINAKKAWYSMTENTPMEYGFGAYEVKKDSLINFNKMKIKILRGETLQNPIIRKKLLENIDG